MLTPSRLRELLHYDPDTGVFTWLVNSRNTKPGQVAGYCRGKYRQISIDGVLYFAHRLAFLHMTGEWPSFDVDHRNGHRSDNRWCNIRPADRSENNQNLGMRSDNSSGYKGVWFNKSNGKWSAMISHRGKRRFLGNFSSAEDAYAAYLAAKSQLHEFQPVPRYEGQAA